MPTPKKPRSDSPLRTLTEAQQAEVIEWLKAKPQGAVRAQIQATHGFSPSSAALSGFWSWWHLRDQLARNEAVVDGLVARLAEREPALSPERLQEIGQSFFSALAIEQQDAKAWALTQREGIRRQALALEQAKFRRETCALFLKWAEDKRAQEIAAGAASNSTKIEQLGQLMFGEDWKAAA